MKKILLILFCCYSISAYCQEQRRELVDSLLTGIRVEKDIRYDQGVRPLHLDVYYPDGAEGKILPCVVWIHGGGLVNATMQKDYDLVRWGVARTTINGYVSVSINYRLITEKPLPTAIEDCETAIRFLKSNALKFGIDTSRIAVVGESAGGFLAGFCTFASDTNVFSNGQWDKVSNQINCGVLWYPGINHTPYNVSDYISHGDVPVLCVHGDSDHVVPIEGSYKLKKKCKEKDVDFQLYVIKGAGHGFFDDTTWKYDETYRRNMEKAIEVTISFLDRHLKDDDSTR